LFGVVLCWVFNVFGVSVEGGVWVCGRIKISCILKQCIS
jgi:hypothetical protein